MKRLYRYYCDLGIIGLKIHTDKPLINGEMTFYNKFNRKFQDGEIVSVYLTDIDRYDEFTFTPQTYREKIMQKGFYIGHHFGEKVKLKIINKNEIYVCARDYNKILWTYITKLTLTLHCLENNYLHLKAGAVKYNKNVILLVGRGGSGKTEIISSLCAQGGKYISNTHSILSADQVLGIKTNIRIRDSEEVEHYVAPDVWQYNNCYNDWTKVNIICWVDYRTDGQITIKEMDSDIMFQNMKQFSEAIANWELHEDIYDYYQSDPYILGELLQDNDQRLRDIINQTETYYVNLDIRKDTVRNQFLQFINTI